jgi:hypothetical protein
MRDEFEKKNQLRKKIKPKEIIIKRMRTKLKKKQKSGMKLKRKSI